MGTRVSPDQSHCNQPAVGAETGQTSAQAPHSMQTSASITYLSPSLIAETGHSPAQAPQAMQSSEITYAILSLPPINLYLHCNTYKIKCKTFTKKIFRHMCTKCLIRVIFREAVKKYHAKRISEIILFESKKPLSFKAKPNSSNEAKPFCA